MDEDWKESVGKGWTVQKGSTYRGSFGEVSSMAIPLGSVTVGRSEGAGGIGR